MHVDRRTVSRKTPRDGKLEISEGAASQLATLGPDIPVEWNAKAGRAMISHFTCTCGKGDGQHEHHFLESPLLTSLPVGAEVDLIVRAGRVVVALTPAG